MIVCVMAMVAVLNLFNLVPSLASERSSVGKPTVVGLGTQMVPPVRFKQALLESLQNQFSIPARALSVKILVPKTTLELPKGAVEIQVPPDSTNGRMGRRAYRMSIAVNKEFERMVNVVADIEVHMPVVVPVRFIRVNETIDAADVRVMDYAMPTLTQDYLKGPESVVGKKATRLLSPNMPIQRMFVAEPPVIHKGDRVIIEARRGGLLVQTVGVARDTGEPGKMITVENLQSKREVIGRVLEAGLVEVIF